MSGPVAQEDRLKGETLTQKRFKNGHQETFSSDKHLFYGKAGPPRRLSSISAGSLSPN